ncbi:uncharacterized protein CDAR_243201 [Caerostris darwini]|uniref:Major facilitator superfamily (MFS) profile domain-containing protein n=1 Tax=Caerostris darwini TaxID=1538125 RepID=A0AAV4MLL0_9ARAC|nr:uncharacterized protein CDAR_243201 [Caerostris darwini]
MTKLCAGGIVHISSVEGFSLSNPLGALIVVSAFGKEKIQDLCPNWDLVCDRSWLPTFAFMFYGIGEFLSLPLYFYVSYRQGRRFSFFLFLACECLFGAVTSLAPNIGCFVILRFLLGLTVPASVATPAALEGYINSELSAGAFFTVCKLIPHFITPENPIVSPRSVLKVELNMFLPAK